jgi:shikimate dehydrogenase
VTIPHKERVVPLVDRLTEEAHATGAVNTITREGKRLVGHNTDVPGFRVALDRLVGKQKMPRHAVVLGAGGGARAVVYGLLQRDVQRVYVVNRTIERAEGLRKAFGPRVHPAHWNEVTGLLGDVGLLVNTTSLGMVGQPALAIDLRPLPADALVTDIVYTPLETALLAAARARGLRAVDGLGMLLHQAVPGFERWFGVRPEVTAELRAAVIAALGSR